MAKSLTIIETVADLRARVASWRADGERIALVPTMGALHEGHLALARQAGREADRVIVSIFVNPTQFAPGEDLSRYPRTFDADRAALEGLADAIYAPGVAEMYPPGDATMIVPEGPALAGLEDRFRPTHFRGVATVVAKLLLQAGPDIAMFGEKDYQQLMVVTRLVADLFIPTRIVPGATVREEDGLALSSRNRYLTPQERVAAPALYAALTACARAIRDGGDMESALDEARAAIAQAGFVIDYVEARDADTLGAPAPGAALRLLAAARMGATRLIDNVGV